jgi:hypothetical protein
VSSEGSAGPSSATEPAAHAANTTISSWEEIELVEPTASQKIRSRHEA